jgi:chitobiase/beta-hexosaminidase-like protein
MPDLYSSRALKFGLAFAVAIICVKPMLAQAGKVELSGLAEDWTHHHVVFSDPGAADTSIGKRQYDHWLKVVNNPRYRLQQARNSRNHGGSGGSGRTSKERIKTDWSMDLGTGATVGAGQWPAKYSFSTTSASCSDWIAYNTGVTGVLGGQANIVAYANLYQGICSATPPTVDWAYYSGPGKALTSPVLSLDGSKIAYIENTSSGAVLRIIQWEAGEGSVATPATPHTAFTNTTAGNVSNSSWGACTPGSSCMISVPFQNGQQDTISAPFYEYGGADTLWVGDASGELHEFSGVFSGTPAEVTTNWPVNVITETTAGLSPAPTNPTMLTGPVYDSVSTLVFVGDGAGYLHSVSTAGAPSISTTANRLACDTAGFADPPLIDLSTEEVYAFVGYGCSSPNQAYINRFTSSLSNPISSQGFGDAHQALTSSGSTASVLRVGNFDAAYYGGLGKTGNLYVCAFGSLLQIPLSTFTNTSGTNYSTYNTPVSASTTCSSVTDFENGSTDSLFMSVGANGNTTANGITCTGACLYIYNVTNSSATTGNPTAGSAEAGGTSGIVIDNGGTAAGESQLYFSTLANQSCSGNGSSGAGTGGCAIQTTQSGQTAAATPSISPNGGSFGSAQTVSISDSTSGAKIYYTTAPGTSFTQYTGSFTVSQSETVEAFAIASGFSTSSVASASFTFTTGSPTVSVTPPRAGLTINQAMSLVAVSSDGSSINWTATGSDCTATACGTFSSPSTASGSAVTYTAPSAAGVYTLTATSATESAVSASATVGVTDLAGVTTYHNDLSRDGVNAQEYALTTSNVTTSTFGKLFSCPVDGNLYAQPLWMANLVVGGSRHNVVFVATENDSLYAFDADTAPCTTLWHVNLIDTNHGAFSGETAVPYSKVGKGSGNIQPVIGVTGTPVIDPATDVLYVVSKSINSAQTTMYQRLHAISLSTGNELLSTGPVTISGTYPTTSGSVAFVTKQENQRPGLALANGVVYVGWAAHEDASPWYGWLMGYDKSTLSLLYTYNTTPNGSPSSGGEGGIWMGGGAPAADSSGKIYVITGNGTFDANSPTAPNNDYGDTLLQLTPSLAVSQYFTPADQSTDNSGDHDFGAGGASVVVDLPIKGNLPNQLVIGGGKDGNLCLLNRNSMGGFSTTNSGADQILTFGNGVFGTPVYWNWSFYLAGNGGKLQQYTLNQSNYQINGTPASTSASTYGSLGATPSLSTNPAGNNSIVWALSNNSGNPTVLRAYNASSLTSELWDSSLTAGNAAGVTVKFTVPTVANGKVYVPTSAELDVYGLLP